MAIVVLTLAFAGVVFILLYYISRLQRQIDLKDVIYVDTTGIQRSPIENFIDVWQGKTINFKCGKYHVKIAQLPALVCLKYIERISLLFNLLKTNLEYKSKNKLDKFKDQIEYLKIYNELSYIIFKLSYQFVNKKIGFRNALSKKCKEDIRWVCDVCEQILDHWAYVKKKINYLARGTTLRQTGGGTLSWDCLNLAGDGKILIKPRYEVLSNIQQN